MAEILASELDLAVEQARQSMTTQQEQPSEEHMNAVELAFDCLAVTLEGDLSKLPSEKIEEAQAIKENVEKFLKG